MQRRGTVRFGTCLASVLLALLLSTFGVGASAMSGAATVAAANGDALPVVTAAVPAAASRLVATPADDVPPAPPGTVSEFYPESANLSDCVGLVEKPGCGSGSRGGWRQMLVFVVLFAGLGVILWRVSRGISSNRRTIDAGIGDAGTSDAGTGADAGSDTGSDVEPDTA